MTNCAYWANFLAASAEYNTTVWINYCLFFVVFLLESECVCVAEFYAFTACCAFGVVYFGVPRDFVSRDSFVFFFWRVVHLENEVFITTFKYCYEIMKKP